MTPNKQKIIAIVGPTATGKSDYAVKLAKEYKKNCIRCAIISADSRQVYKHLNIGSGKVTKKEMGGIPHYLLDVVHPRSTYSVERYVRDATKVLAKLQKEHILPIVCGGTGFYIDALLLGQKFPEVKPNLALRKKLDTLSAKKLFTMLEKKDPKRASTIDKHNRVRLIRALEIIDALGNVPPLSEKESPYAIEWIGLDMDDEVLKARIHKRLYARMKQGMLAETKSIHEKKNIPWKKLERFGLEYKYMALLAQHKMDKDTAIGILEKEIWQYAKRQRTWFKRSSEIVWIKK